VEENPEYAGRLLAERYRLPLPSADAYELAESLAWDTASGQEVLVHQVPLPEVIDAEVVVDGYGAPDQAFHGGPHHAGRAAPPSDPAVRRAMEAAVAAAQLPDHPRLDQVFDVFVEDDGLWIVSELVPASTPLAALLAERPLGAHRAAEIAADLLNALRIVHANGWVHRNVTARTVLICEDGRALLTGLAVGAAQEALCGYDPLPPPTPDAGPPPPGSGPGPEAGPPPGSGPGPDAGTRPGPGPEPEPGPDGPATWTGQRLPEGFTARESGSYERREQHEHEQHEPYAQYAEYEQYEQFPRHPRHPRPEQYGDRGYRESGIASYGGPQGERPRGIFGFEGIEPEDPEGLEGPGGPEGPEAGAFEPSERTEHSPPGQAFPGPGSGPNGREGASGALSARAARRGAIAAYREGTQRAAADTRDAGRRAPGGPPDGGRGEATGREVTDWWSTAPDSRTDGQDAEGSAGGSGSTEGGRPGTERGRGHAPMHALDDDVRWLPSDEDEVLPDALNDDGGASTGAAVRDEIYGPHAAGPYGVAPPNGRPDEYDTPPADSGPTALPVARGADSSSVSWDASEAPWAGAEAPAGRYRGPATALEAERARHARITVVGPVTERWAPEQAGTVYENWRLAPPVGPAADLWALGVLLFRAVQGYAPYPEDSAPELVQLVCAEPPAFAEDCGPLRPVVESLMRQDPTERPDFEELRGWLRSIIRSAPEPDVGLRTVTAPLTLEPGGPADPRRLPIIRRRGELVRRRRRARRDEAAAVARSQDQEQRQERSRAQEPSPPLAASHAEPVEYGNTRRQSHRREREPRRNRDAGGRKQSGGPRRLGLLVLALILLGMAAAVAFVALFLPGNGEGKGNQKGSVVVPERTEGDAQGGDGHGKGGNSADGAEDAKAGEKKENVKDDGNDKSGKDGKKGKGEDGSGGAPSTAAKAPKGYRISNDPAGFRIAVPKEWDRRSSNGRGQVRYNGGEVEMVIVNGRDTTRKYGKDPMSYQSEDEPELSAYRASDWASTGGLRRIDVGDTAMAEGTFSWREGGGRQVYARNRAMILDGHYHVLLVIGSSHQKADIDKHFEAVADTYRVTRAP
jgi:serine/threonine protein kinase